MGRLAVIAVLLLSAPAPPPPVPAAPVALTATNGASSISLTWAQPATGTRPVSFRVYEGTTVVARNTTTGVTVVDLAFGSTHTYRVTAVDARGRESAPSAPVTRSAMLSGVPPCGMVAPTGLAVTAVTATAVSLSWSTEIPQFEQPGPLVVLRDGVEVRETSLGSARIGGLTPATAYAFQVARRDCHGMLHPGQPVTVTTAAGAPARVGTPSAPVVGARTATSIALSWTAPPGGAGGRPAGYAVYDGGTRVAVTGAGTTSAVVGRLWRDTAHEFTVAALDPAGGESAHSDPAWASTQPCPDPRGGPLNPVNAPTAVTATAKSPSTVSLAWVQEFDAESFTVLRTASGTLPLGPVATTRRASAVVTGLPSGDTSTYAVVAQTSCGASPPSRPVTVSTPGGPAARPEAPTGLTAMTDAPFPESGTVTLTWTQPPGADPAVGFRLYEGADLFATSATTSVTLRLPGGPSHLVTAVAVDAAGNESAQSPPVFFTVPFLPPP